MSAEQTMPEPPVAQTLLKDSVSRESDQQRDHDATTDRIIDSLNQFHRTHGLMSDEFSTL